MLNAVHHAARPDIYASTTLDFSRNRRHWLGFSERPGQVVWGGVNTHAQRLYAELGFETRAIEMGLAL